MTVREKYTDEQKLQMYAQGKCVFNTPPVCTRFWSTEAWIRWIDRAGEWRP